ncbi:MAG: DUF3795 domain-containing protein [Halobacteriota archaeon]
MLDSLSLNVELIAPCGINCSVCSRYLAHKYDLRSKGIRVPYCTGCRLRGKKCAFLIKRCDLLTNHKAQFCFECSSFPCRNLERINDRYQKHYRTSLIENLTYIEQHSLAAFAQKENAKWQCAKCGAELCCHNGVCYNCGVNSLQKRKKWYLWEDDQ